MGRSRRTLLRSALLLAGGGAVGAAATRLPGLLGPDRLPIAGGYAPANDHIDAVHHPSTVVTYYVQTTEPVVAFTFDDGPGPQWTSMVLDVLDAYQVPATFFVVGRNLQDHANLLRPPWGHLGGSTLLAADSLGYDLVLWSHQMHEQMYRDNPTGQVRDIVGRVTPGAIVLAHDVGSPERLVALRQLGAMFSGLRARGYRFVTVSELMAIGKPAPAPV